MTSPIRGLHHVTAITGDAAANARFWTRCLGLRLVKRTVNFDAPSVWHLYYGDETGHPGTVMTFFAYQGAAPGRIGRGQATLTQFSVPERSLEDWADRLGREDGVAVRRETVFGEARLTIDGPEGLGLSLTVPAEADPRTPWTGGGTGDARAIRGFHGVTLTLAEAGPTAAILTDLFGYEETGREASGDATLIRYRRAGSPAGVVDILADPAAPAGIEGAGSVHHVAFEVADDAAELAVREEIAAAGHRVTPQIDRDYFRSIYFRTPGGVLFEVATAVPGFTVDEPAETLGSALRIPAQHRHLREKIEAALPALGL